MQNARLNPQIIAVSSSITADGTIPAFVASCTSEIVAIYASVQTTLAAGTSNLLSLQAQDGGSVGTGTTAIHTARLSGATTAWTALTKYTLLAETATPYQIDKGDQVNVAYDETSTVAVGQWTVTFHVVPGTAN